MKSKWFCSVVLFACFLCGCMQKDENSYQNAKQEAEIVSTSQEDAVSIDWDCGDNRRILENAFTIGTMEPIDDLHFKEEVISNVIIGKGEILDRGEWIEAGKCYRVAIQRADEVEYEYNHLRDYIFVRDDGIKTIVVDYPSKKDAKDSERYVWNACDFRVEYADVSFDGEKDILISLGHCGPQGDLIYCAYVYENDIFVYKHSFENILNYSRDDEQENILGWMVDGADKEERIYKYVDGDFKLIKKNIYGYNYEMGEFDLIRSESVSDN